MSLSKSLAVLFTFVWLGWAQQAPPPGCKPLTYFGVQGCEPDQGKCLKGYHKKAACPSDPRMKAPCRLVCVADEPGKKDDGKKDDGTKGAGAAPKPR
jgi:hypothetical protein